MTLAVWFVLKFYVEPMNKKWRILVQEQESMAANVFPPEEDILIEIGE